MVESKTLSKKSEISYYRIFGWRKVGEYHGPSLMGTESLVSTDGKVMLKDKIVDEYYLQRDMSDSRYKTWLQNEHDYRKYYDLARKTEIEAKEVKQGLECGITIENFNDIKEMDIVEGYIDQEVKPE